MINIKNLKMTKTIKLYFDMEFTSLSPDAQVVSLGIISDCGKNLYAEFSDFDINCCDDWVKTNVVEKLHLDEYGDNVVGFHPDNSITVYGDVEMIRSELKSFLLQFYDYQIQFVADCGTYDWYWLVQLLAEWDALIDGVELVHNARQEEDALRLGQGSRYSYKIGLPKLPDNISPVPEDLNDLIARSKGISVREAFDLNREELADLTIAGEGLKHSALWDAKVIKEIYQKLK